jgi:GTP cyclohydrolase II
MFGEALRATDCDCGVQLEAAVKAICAEGGIITYAWEEGRGLGIAGKLRAIALQQSKGIDTAEAFRILGHPPEPRSFDNHVAALRLVHDGTQVRLASANPAKVAALARAGFEVVERLTLEIPTTPERASYLEEKTTSLGHLRCDP